MRWAMVALVLAAGGCVPNPEGRAAGRAQDACIAALEPVAQRRVPTAAELAQASRVAEAAAAADERWVPLRQRVRELAEAVSGGADPQAAVDALADECRHVNDIVRTSRR